MRAPQPLYAIRMDGNALLEVAFMKLALVVIVVTALVAPALSMQDNQSPEAAAPSATNDFKALPAMNLQDFSGKAIPSDRFKGNILVLDFWATWCVPCIAEIPTLNHLQEKYGAKGVTVLGVTMASGEAAEVKPFVGRNKMKYTVVMGDDDQVYDLNVVAFPTTYLVTRDMKVFRKYIGAGPKKAAELEADLLKLLAVN
jgi:thiol-disulfide isomerase/thioredoxin